ncbi:MAG: hypothetical protein AB7S69_13245 [Salinivirgaceae bacterium]
MEKYSFIFFVVLSIVAINTNAQITIREEKIVEKPVLKPQEFDSLSNFVEQKQPINYKKYIGYKLFFLPTSENKTYSGTGINCINFLYSNKTNYLIKNRVVPFESILSNQIMVSQLGNVNKLRGKSLEKYNAAVDEYNLGVKEETNIYQPIFYYEKTDMSTGSIYGNVGTNPDSVENQYFTIIDIKGKYLEKEYKRLEDIEIPEHKYSNWYRSVSLKISLKNESNNDTLFWILKRARDINKSPFFLVPYFEKLKDLVLNQNFVVKTNVALENLVDVNTGELINIAHGEVWKCTDISFANSNDFYLTPYYFLKNGDREIKIKLGIGELNKHFLFETDYIKHNLEKQKKADEKQKENEEKKRIKQEQYELEQQLRIKFRNDCIIKWGKEMGNYIADEKVIIGMNMEMCRTAWGKPIDINRTIVRELAIEQWVYGWGTYLYFKNGILEGIQN